MEEELNYATVTFKSNGISTHENPNHHSIIYDEVKSGERAWDTNHDAPENIKKAPLCTLLHLVAAGLGIMCVILASVVIVLCMHFHTVMSEQYRENTNLTAQNLQLRTEKSALERRTEELTREKDGLSWSIGVILQYETFPVKTHCPQKVCKPCLDGWVLFQSKCYQFFESEYSRQWGSWAESRDKCRQVKADLVVIESQEEQEFINNHTKVYNDDNHGYWIGLSNKDVKGTWMWVDGSNFTVTYWMTQNASYTVSCALTLPRGDPLANWHKASCDMRNRWICETRALIKQSAASSKLII